MNKKSKTIISCLMAVMCILENKIPIVHAQDNDTFESYRTVSNLEMNGQYSLNYVLKNYNAFVENNYTGQHVVGPVICGGNFTGYLGGCTTGEVNCYWHQVASFVGNTTGNLTVNSFNDDLNFYMSQAAKESHYKVDNTVVKYRDQFVDFEKAMASFTSEAQSLAKDAIKVNVTKTSEDYRYINDWAKRIQLQSGKTYDITGITCAKTIDVRNTEAGGDIIIYSADEEVQMPRTFYNGAQIMPSEVGNGTGIVYLFPNAKKVIGADYSKVGHIVAPNAMVEMGTGDYNGCIIAKEVNTASEGHLWTYNGQKIPAPTQELEINHATESELEEIEWETAENFATESELEDIDWETAENFATENELEDIDWETVEEFETEPITAIKLEPIEEIEPSKPEITVPELEINHAIESVEEVEWETAENFATESELEDIEWEIAENFATENELEEIEWETAENFATENELEDIDWETVEEFETEPITAIKLEPIEEIEPSKPEITVPELEINHAIESVEEVEWETAENFATESELEDIEWEIAENFATENELEEIEWETAENFATESELEDIEWETAEEIEPFEPEIVEPEVIIPEVPTSGNQEQTTPDTVIPEELAVIISDPELPETGTSTDNSKESLVANDIATAKETKAATTKQTLPQTGTVQMNTIHVTATMFTLLSTVFIFKSKK